MENGEGGKRQSSGANFVFCIWEWPRFIHSVVKLLSPTLCPPSLFILTLHDSFFLFLKEIWIQSVFVLMSYVLKLVFLPMRRTGF